MNNSSNSTANQEKIKQDSLFNANLARVDSMEAAAKLNILEEIESYDIGQYKDQKASVVANGIADFERWEETATILSSASDVKSKEIGQKAIKKIAAARIKYFPLLRKYWADAAAREMWEHDIEVSVSGKGYTILTFTGGTFAANANIKSTQETLNQTFHDLRFKQARYKWYSGDDEYTYFDLKTKTDSESVSTE